MTLTVKHPFVSTIPDDPAAVAAGEVVPSGWNAAHNVTGAVGPEIGARTILTANTNYYVTATGSDANDGSLAHPWGTWQHAWFFIAAKLDLAGFIVTINIGAGTFAGAGFAGAVGSGIIFTKGAGVGSTILTAGPNDGIFNFGDVFDTEIISSTGLYFNNLTVKVPDNGVSELFGFNLSVATPNFVVGDPFTGNTGTVSFKFDTSLCTSGNSSCLGTFAPCLVTWFSGTITVAAGASGGVLFFVYFSEDFTVLFDFASWVITGTLNAFFFLQASIDAFIFPLSPNSFTGTNIGGRANCTYGGDIIGFGTLGPTYYPGTGQNVIDALGSSYDSIIGPSPFFSTQTSNYTLQYTDATNFAVIEMNVAGANTFTIPPDSSLPAGAFFGDNFRIKVVQTGAGATTITAGMGVTIDGAGAIGGQYKSAFIYRKGANHWLQTV